VKTQRILAAFLLVCLCLTGCQKRQAVKVDNEPLETGTTESEEPVELDDITLDGMAKDFVDQMTLRQKIGQLFIVNLELLDESQGSFYEYTEFTKAMAATLRRYHPGGVIFFSRNIETPEQTKTLISNLQEGVRIPMFISVDEEGGSVARIASNPNMGTTAFPTMEEIGSTEDEEYVYNMGVTIGSEIHALGFNLDFAPVADVKTNELNTEIGDRSFGSDAKWVSSLVKQMVTGLQEQKVSATLKHFPGHGDADEDTHQGPVDVEGDLNRLRSVEFRPFSAGIKAGADCVMVTHLSVSSVTGTEEPASMSTMVVQQILRKELGFEGVAITDAMDMGAITKIYEPGEAAVNAIRAGIDIVLMPVDLEEAYNAVLAAVNSGEITEKQLEESVTRIIRTKIKRGIIEIEN
jgi:beta-N-acetylhexosaminidase